MGSCFSSTCIGSTPSSISTSSSSPSARVVSITGALKDYTVPITVSSVIESEVSNINSPDNYFICNSDRLYYDDYIPALNVNEELIANQIYFILPKSKLQNKLSASDMAALAVKASVALQNASKKDSNRRKKARISPILLVNTQHTASFYPDADNCYEDEKTIDKRNTLQSFVPITISRSSSVKRLQKYTSKRAKLAVRSFRMRLSTIYEDSVRA
ncbi:hypothetical protein ACFE04_008706 [Oxalis oulophora]